MELAFDILKWRILKKDSRNKIPSLLHEFQLY